MTVGSVGTPIMRGERIFYTKRDGEMSITQSLDLNAIPHASETSGRRRNGLSIHTSLYCPTSTVV